MITLEPLSYPDNKVYGANTGPPRSCRPQMGPMLAPWTLLSGKPAGYGWNRQITEWEKNKLQTKCIFLGMYGIHWRIHVYNRKLENNTNKTRHNKPLWLFYGAYGLLHKQELHIKNDWLIWLLRNQIRSQFNHIASCYVHIPRRQEMVFVRKCPWFM